MTRYYETQPEVLPETLPLGTVIGRAWPIKFVLHLVDGAYYAEGNTRYHPGLPDRVHWGSVPIPEPAEPECAACGSTHLREMGVQVDSSLAIAGIPLGTRFCWACTAPGSDIASCIAAYRRRNAGDAAVIAQAGLCSTPECAARGVVATHASRCVYCEQTRFEPKDRRLDVEPKQVAARARIAATERIEIPRVTAASRELSKGHPSTWPEGSGDD